MLHAGTDATGEQPATSPGHRRKFTALVSPHVTSSKLGYDIVLNFGDQWSDLQGGYADTALKLPNPTYYLAEPRPAPRPTTDVVPPRTASR